MSLKHVKSSVMECIASPLSGGQLTLMELFVIVRGSSLSLTGLKTPNGLEVITMALAELCHEGLLDCQLFEDSRVRYYLPELEY